MNSKMTKQEIQKEADLVYRYVLQVASEMDRPYIHSWWLNKRNCPELWMETPRINQRCRLLVRQGKLAIDPKHTSHGTGTRYRILELEDAHDDNPELIKQP